MMNEDHNRALDALRAVRDKIIEPSIAKSGGTVVKRLGDGWLAAFDAGTDACASALDIQKQLASDDSVDLRIGIHDGAVSFVDEDVFGTGVNIASRLEAIANPGGIAISDDVFENLPHNLQASFENAGARLLKNIEAPVTVWAFGGIPQTGAASEPISVLFEELAAKSASSELASDIPEAVAVELAKYRWLDVLRKDQDGSKSTYILGGTFRQSEDRVLITVTLSARHDGRRLWSERLDRVVTDDFELLDELGGTLALRISAEIDTYEKMRAKMRPPEQLNAAELSSRANDLMSSGHPDAFDEADAMLTRAVALEPRNPSVHIQKSFVGYRKAMSGAWPVDATLNAAVQSAMDAVRIDPKMPGGHVMLTSVYGMLGQTEAALDSAAQIEHLNPNAWGAPHGRSIAYTFASPEWAEKNDPDGQHLIANAEHTLALAKTSKFRSGHLFFLGIGQLTNSSAELQDAISTLERSAGATGANWWPSLFLILAALRQDNKQQAQQHVDTVCALFPGFSVSDAADIFERSRIWPLWKNEIEQLAHLEFPKARPITPSASL